MPPRKRVERWREVPGATTRRPKSGPGGGMYEKEFTELVMDLCKWMRIYCYHTHDSRHSVAGFPDLFIMTKRGIMFRELKQETGRLSKEQADVLTLLRASGQDAGVWRPSDLAHGTIKRELEELKGVGLN